MPDRTDIAYAYDGSFEGLMSCVFEAFERKELPAMLLGGRGFPGGQACLLETREIATDERKAERVLSGLAKRVGIEMLEYIETSALCEAPEIDLNTLKFIKLAFRHGLQSIDMLTVPCANAMFQANRALRGEAHLLCGFIRFRDAGGALTATITPKNHVLPIIRPHFEDRFNAEAFMIYDKTHREALVHQNGRSGIFPLDILDPPAASEAERHIESLWRGFYEAIGIAERENPRCRMGHMPKRFWANMVEMLPELSVKSSIPAQNPRRICYNHGIEAPEVGSHEHTDLRAQAQF